MKPQARIQATIDIFERLYGSRVPLDTVVGDYMRQRRYIGSKDRSNIAERVYDISRATARIGWWLERGGMENTPRSRVLTFLALGEGADEKRLAGLFDGSKYAPEELTPQELEYIKQIRHCPACPGNPEAKMDHPDKPGDDDGGAGDDDGGAGDDVRSKALFHPDMPQAIRAECPPQYEESLKAYFGEAFEEEMSAMLGAATLDLRVNTVLADKDKVRKFLEADGVETDEGEYAPKALRCKSKTYLSRTKAFGKGWIEIQDEGSQLIAHLCGAKPGMQVLDYCAGSGGKTLALAADMAIDKQPKGRIVAMDLDERRLMKSRERFKKARVSDIIEPRPLSEPRHMKWLKRQKGSFDIVLCDVPCTGTGTWRRNPDMRWNTYGPALSELTEIQAEILDKVAHTVKPGGRLVYATCSLLPEENEQQIEAFLARHEGFEVEPLDKTLGLGTPYMRLTPHRHKTDGFFAAVLKRV